MRPTVAAEAPNEASNGPCTLNAPSYTMSISMLTRPKPMMNFDAARAPDEMPLFIIIPPARVARIARPLMARNAIVVLNREINPKVKRHDTALTLAAVA